MARKIRMYFERGGTLTAELLENKAPRTCELIWQQLPQSGRVLHARWTGREVFLRVNLGTKPPREHQNFVMSRGEMMYWREWEDCYEQTGAEVIAFFYGPEYLRAEWRGYGQGNVFAQIPQDQWEEMERIGLRVWQQGGEIMTLCRHEAE
jgi:hypothetical protein